MMIRRRLHFCGVVAALMLGNLLAATTPFAKEPLADFRQQVPLALEGNGPWYSLDIPMNVQIAASNADLRDLRVFDASGQAQPYALMGSYDVQPTSPAREAEARLFPLRGFIETGKPPPDIRIQQNGTIVEVRSSSIPTSSINGASSPQLRGWLLDASALDFLAERLQLDWSGNQNEESFQTFTIEASDDLERWSNWGTGQIARLSFDGNRLDVSEVKLPLRRAKYLRLLWPYNTAAVELKSARLFGSPLAAAPAPLNWSSPVTGHREKDGEFLWKLPLSLPIQRVRIALAPDQTNIVAPVDLSGRNLTKQSSQRQSSNQENYWSPLARGVLYRLQQDGRAVQVDELEIKYPLPIKELRLRVDQRGSGFGAGAPNLSFAMPGSRIVFLAQGQAPYQLAFDNEKALAANLPISVLIPRYDESKPPAFGKATIGEIQIAAPIKAEQSTSSRGWKKYGLWAVLLIGVGLLVLMATSLIKKS